jgi:DNA-directed RNA polymerase subunit RPC12/RpoP
MTEKEKEDDITDPNYCLRCGEKLDDFDKTQGTGNLCSICRHQWEKIEKE